MVLTQAAAGSSIGLIGVDAQGRKLVSKVLDQPPAPARLWRMRGVEQHADIGATLPTVQDWRKAVTGEMQATTRLGHPLKIALPVGAVKGLQEECPVPGIQVLSVFAETIAMVRRSIEVDEQARDASQHWFLIQLGGQLSGQTPASGIPGAVRFQDGFSLREAVTPALGNSPAGMLGRNQGSNRRCSARHWASSR